MPLPSEILRNKFPFEPTKGQKMTIELLDGFLEKGSGDKSVFLLKGYAGTGKTSLVTTLVNVLPLFNYKYNLLAPTGRAAKVMSTYCRKVAWTIHKRIYKLSTNPDSGKRYFVRQENYYKNTIFIVDEASMLSEESDFGSPGLLADLVNYIFANTGNKLILVGDIAQLPPVGQTRSPALDESYLSRHYKLNVQQSELTEVMRQDVESGILANATRLRNLLHEEKARVILSTSRYEDTFKMTGERMEDGLRYAYDKYGIENTVIVTRSNRAAVQYNQFIRNQLLYREDEIDVGDLLMVVRNNYYYKDNPAGFVANGDFVEVLKVIDWVERHGFRFARMRLRFIDYENIEPMEAWILLNTLHQYTTSLSDEEAKKLYESVHQDYADIGDKKEYINAINNDPFLNALQVKYAYALTCHKSQGGQWNAVFVDQGYLKEEMINHEFLRWLYTAITRAQKELFLVNFAGNFFQSVTSHDS